MWTGRMVSRWFSLALVLGWGVWGTEEEGRGDGGKGMGIGEGGRGMGIGELG